VDASSAGSRRPVREALAAVDLIDYLGQRYEARKLLEML